MRKNLLTVWQHMGVRARVALSLAILWVLSLAVIGFINTLDFWLDVFAIGSIVALSGIAVKLYIQRQTELKAEIHRTGAANFLFSFLQTYWDCMPIRLKPIADANELQRKAYISVKKGITTVSFGLLLTNQNNLENTDNLFLYAEWLRSYAGNYGIQNNVQGWGMFPFYYAENCEFLGQHLVVKILIVENSKAAAYISNPPQPETPSDIIVDDDTDQKNNDIELD